MATISTRGVMISRTGVSSSSRMEWIISSSWASMVPASSAPARMSLSSSSETRETFLGSRPSALRKRPETRLKKRPTG
jgi:hypothetical protein